MNSRTIISAAVTVGLFAVMMVSPVGYPAVAAKVSQKEAETARVNTYQFNLNSAKNALLESVNTYNETRVFDVYYGDISKIYDVLTSVAGITVSGITKVDPAQGYVDAGAYTEGDTPLAVEFQLLTDDASSAIRIINKMELPIYEIDWQSPNSLSVIFLTGGEL